ncbi:hypothetical protein LR948_08815 [Roseivivax sp. GX 12232]|uniref:aminoglycoside phosphotransferase family protein n=1 Tax=Roseivivax sp. GX 12232 TaxID=2900547 RepID=UPI001E2F5622|nr:aminoglycoside phosphotransferase family protein [Roseivivax sp. GX 12232]MCE0505451.1 hypothetical protein [Roseivivax sp. GX 12232]
MARDLEESDIAQILAEWDLTLKAEGPSRSRAQIYEVAQADGSPAILKVYHAGTPGYEAEAPELLAVMEGHRCVRLLRASEKALLLEHLDGALLTHIVERGGDAEATEIIIDVAEAIRARRQAFTPERRLDKRFSAMFMADPAASAVLSNAPFRTALGIATAALDRDARGDRGMLHGDLHHTNIIGAPRHWCTIDPLPLFGEPEAEYALALSNPSHMPRIANDPNRQIRMAERIHARTGLDPSRILSWGVTFAANKLAMDILARPEDSEQHQKTETRLSSLLEAYERVPRD